ncbi:MAG: hypothetical protein AB7R55_01605 [Gemmatimonadales bacterium]
MKWTAVPNASSYRIFRGTSDTYKRRLWERPAANLHANAEPGYASTTDMSIDETSTYWYEVQAVFYDATGRETVSTMSPSASATSLPIVPPRNLRYSTSTSTTRGHVQVILSWDGVPGATSYDVTGRQAWPGHSLTLNPGRSGRSTKMVIDATVTYLPDAGYMPGWLRPGETYLFCVSADYPRKVIDDPPAICVTAAL